MTDPKPQRQASRSTLVARAFRELEAATRKVAILEKKLKTHRERIKEAEAKASDKSLDLMGEVSTAKEALTAAQQKFDQLTRGEADNDDAE